MTVRVLLLISSPYDTDERADPEEEKELFRTDPEAFYRHTQALSAATMHLFGTFLSTSTSVKLTRDADVFLRGSLSPEMVKEIVRNNMISELKDEDLIAKLVPEYVSLSPFHLN